MLNWQLWLENLELNHVLDAFFQEPSIETFNEGADWLQERNDVLGRRLVYILNSRRSAKDFAENPLQIEVTDGFVHVMLPSPANIPRIKFHYTYSRNSSKFPKVSYAKTEALFYIGTFGQETPRVLSYLDALSNKRYGSDPIEKSSEKIEDFKNKMALNVAGHALNYDKLPKDVLNLMILGICELVRN